MIFSTGVEHNGHRGAMESEGMKLHGGCLDTLSIKTGRTENSERLKKNTTKATTATREYNNERCFSISNHRYNPTRCRVDHRLVTP